MFTSFALLCPGVMLFIWVLVFITKKKNTSQTIMTFTLAVSAIHFTVDGIFISHSVSPYVAAIVNTIRQIFGPMMLPLLVTYYRAISGQKPVNWHTAVWFMLVIAQSVATLLFFFLLGPDNLGDYMQALVNNDTSDYTSRLYTFYNIICFKWYGILMLMQFTYSIGTAIVMMRKNPFSLQEIKDVWQGNSGRMYALIAPATISLLVLCIIRRLIGYHFMITNPYTAAGFSIMLALFAHIICFACNQNKNVELYTDDDNDFDPSRSMGKEITVDEKLLPLLPKLQKLIDKDRYYLHATINATKVAQKLHTNSTYVYALISQQFHMTFREYINRKRVDYAKELLLSNPDALLEYIATQCGYLSTSAFSKNFQQFTGLPPRLWVMNERVKKEET